MERDPDDGIMGGPERDLSIGAVTDPWSVEGSVSRETPWWPHRRHGMREVPRETTVLDVSQQELQIAPGSNKRELHRASRAGYSSRQDTEAPRDAAFRSVFAVKRRCGSTAESGMVGWESCVSRGTTSGRPLSTVARSPATTLGVERRAARHASNVSRPFVVKRHGSPCWAAVRMNRSSRGP